jgi:hypothetical protein
MELAVQDFFLGEHQQPQTAATVERLQIAEQVWLMLVPAA